MWARIHLIPALQAEEDRDQVRRYLADKAREKELLGSETRVYNSDRYTDSGELRRMRFANVCTQVRSTDLCHHTGTRDQVRAGEVQVKGARIARVHIRAWKRRVHCALRIPDCSSIKFESSNPFDQHLSLCPTWSY
jgi:hypothetical protein